MYLCLYKVHDKKRQNLTEKFYTGNVPATTGNLLTDLETLQLTSPLLRLCFD